MTLGPRPALVLTLPALASALLMLAQPASAQTPEPAKADASLERAQKAADAVFHWIKLNGDKGANRSPTTPAPAPAPAPVARKAAPAPTPVAAAPRPAPTPAPAPVTTQTAATTADTVTSPASAVAQAPASFAPQEPPVMVASAAPTPTPDSPMVQAAKAVEPPPEPEDEDEEPLQLLSKVNPTMPRQLPPTFTRGIAQVQFTIAPNGQVAQAQVLKATHSRLGTAAMEAVKQWRFAPITKARNVAIEIAFSKEDS